MKTKSTTIANDIITLNSRDLASQALEAAKSSVRHATDHAVTQEQLAHPCADLLSARHALITADETVRKIPRPRRDAARSAMETGNRLARHALATLTEDYSGATVRVVRILTSLGAFGAARTVTGKGEAYSRRCTYRKTDATHTVFLAPEGLPELDRNPELVAASQREGLPLIDLRQDGSCVWVRKLGHGIDSRAGWVAYDPETRTCYHSEASMEKARAGLSRKVAAAKRVADKRLHQLKADRRERLIIRLCHSAIATIEDARALGYCLPGIQAFQARHGVGDTASLPELVRTGNPEALKLALHVARKLRKTGSLTPA